MTDPPKNDALLPSLILELKKRVSCLLLGGEKCLRKGVRCLSTEGWAKGRPNVEKGRGRG